MSYQPPPQSDGGASGGYTPPPPPSGGGYEPPPPPPGGGYNAPPAMGGGGGSGSGGGGSLNFNELIQSYIAAVTKPNAGTFEGEIPRANMTKTLIGVFAVALIGALAALLGGLIGAATIDPAQLDQLRRQLREANIDFDPGFLVGGGVGIVGALTTFVGTFVTFFLGTAIQWGVAKMLGGQGSDFGTQAYLSSLSYAPLGVVGALLGIVPIVGDCVAFVLRIYQIVLVGFSLQASQRMQPGKAMLAAFVPAIVVIVLFCLCFGLIFALIAMAAGSVNR